MINAYKNGKDLYATIASGVYHNRYEDNLEFKDVLKPIEPQNCIISSENNIFKLLLSDTLKTNRGLIEAKDLKLSDIIETSEGVKTITSKEIEGVYCIITIN